MKKAKLLTTLGAVALIGAIGMGSTLAYLTSTTETLTNTFTVGNVNFDANAGLRESEVARRGGVYVDTDGARTWNATGNTYENLVANETVYKDPTVRMAADSQDAWVFAMVENIDATVNGVKAFSSITVNTNEWTDVTAAYKRVNNITGDVTYRVYAKTAIISAGQPSTIFTNVTMGNLTSGMAVPQINVTACAVQAAGFEDERRHGQISVHGYEKALSEVTFGAAN